MSQRVTDERVSLIIADNWRVSGAEAGRLALDLRDARALLVERDAEVAQLVAALGPFAKMAGAFPPQPSTLPRSVQNRDGDTVYAVHKHGVEAEITVGDLRRADAAVRAAKGER